MNKIKSYKDIQGWFSSEWLYFSAISQCSDDMHSDILEVGTWLGKSTAFLATTAKIFNKDLTIYAVDTFTGEQTCDFQIDIVNKNGGSILDAFNKNIKDLNFNDIVVPIVSDSHSCLSKINVKFFDLIFLDANHAYNYVYKDLNYLFPALKSGGLFIGDDFNKDVKKAAIDFCRENKLNLYSKDNSFIIKNEKI